MPTLNISVLDGSANPVLLRAEDLGSGASASSLGSGQVYVPHNHDAIFKTAWDRVKNVGLTVLYSTGSISAIGANTVIAAPGAGNYIEIAYISLQNEGSTETLVLLNSANDTRSRHLLSAKTVSGSKEYVAFPEYARLRMATNAAMVLNLSVGGNAIGYSIGYVVKAA